MQFFKGKVISNKLPNCATVAVAYSVRHKKYKKTIQRTTKLHAHHELEVQVGDVVKIAQIKPLSKTVYFKIVEIVSPGGDHQKKDTTVVQKSTPPPSVAKRQGKKLKKTKKL